MNSDLAITVILFLAAQLGGNIVFLIRIQGRVSKIETHVVERLSVLETHLIHMMRKGGMKIRAHDKLEDFEVDEDE